MTKELKQEVFYKLPKSLLMIDFIVVPETKEKVSLTLGDKLVWVYLYNQYESYKKQNMKFFETREQISLSCCLSLISVKRTLTKLKSINALEIQKNNLGGCVQNNIYTKVLTPIDLLGLEFYDKEGNIIDLKRFTLTGNPNQKISTKTNLSTQTNTQTNLVKQNKPITFVSDSEEYSLPDWAK